MDDAKIAEKVTEATRTVLENMMKLEEINDRTVHVLAQKQFAAAGDYMSSAVKRLRTLNEAKDMKDAMASQADLASELSEKMLNHAKTSLEVLNNSKSELNAVIGDSLSRFFEMANPKGK
ncbi:MAG: phasin family protein [Magnetococcales bacterium]|nr:phasin family protein [Magnetococcales bacterium]NGZ26068.1 phasin family protein [Magnetococcales bacterium]